MYFPINAGRTNATETEKRHMYWPPNKPLVAEVLCGNKPNIQVRSIFLQNNYISWWYVSNHKIDKKVVLQINFLIGGSHTL